MSSAPTSSMFHSLSSAKANSGFGNFLAAAASIKPKARATRNGFYSEMLRFFRRDSVEIRQEWHRGTIRRVILTLPHHEPVKTTLQLFCRGLILSYSGEDMRVLAIGPPRSIHVSPQNHDYIKGIVSSSCIASGDFVVKPVLDGTILTFYWFDGEWRIATSKGFDVGDLMFSSDRTTFKQAAEALLPRDWYDRLDRDWSYSVGFRHHSFHPIIGDPQKVWFCRATPVAKVTALIRSALKSLAARPGETPAEFDAIEEALSSDECNVSPHLLVVPIAPLDPAVFGDNPAQFILAACRDAVCAREGCNGAIARRGRPPVGDPRPPGRAGAEAADRAPDRIPFYGFVYQPRTARLTEHQPRTARLTEHQPRATRLTEHQPRAGPLAEQPGVQNEINPISAAWAKIVGPLLRRNILPNIVLESRDLDFIQSTLYTQPSSLAQFISELSAGKSQGEASGPLIRLGFMLLDGYKRHGKAMFRYRLGAPHNTILQMISKFLDAISARALTFIGNPAYFRRIKNQLDEISDVRIISRPSPEEDMITRVALDFAERWNCEFQPSQSRTAGREALRAVSREAQHGAVRPAAGPQALRAADREAQARAAGREAQTLRSSETPTLDSMSPDSRRLIDEALILERDLRVFFPMIIFIAQHIGGK